MRMSTALCNGADKGKKDEPKAAGGGFLVNMVPTQFEGIVKLDPKMKGPESDLEPKDGELEENSNEEMTNMKELLLIHLDFIQLQSEQLQKRDKLIEDLKNENEMLKQRIARMERRVSLQRSNTTDKRHQQNSEVPETGRKRRTQDATPSGPSGSAGKKAFTETQQKRLKVINRQSKLDGLKMMNEKKIDLSDKLTTDKLYYTGVGDSDVKMLGDVLNNNPKSKVCLEVPQWRIKPLTSTYTMEGTENLSDDVFDRRHYKLMVDEKKRKRWDVQRIREQRQIEKHRSRENAGNNNDQASSRSLWPQAGEGLQLAMTPILPVSVFGINLPVVTEHHDFTLPWKEGTRSSRRRTKR
ncbi:unnamed protein product [Nezara viridula]|uniref:PEHE domain-containing protein n=1 Tax=Nezara viridula TaxID=85310 RepID=A0A9P0EB59_NEZVI|nr:unnamed protein product [Nezara viridula]